MISFFLRPRRALSHLSRKLSRSVSRSSSRTGLQSVAHDAPAQEENSIRPCVCGGEQPTHDNNADAALTCSCSHSSVAQKSPAHTDCATVNVLASPASFATHITSDAVTAITSISMERSRAVSAASTLRPLSNSRITQSVLDATSPYPMQSPNLGNEAPSKYTLSATEPTATPLPVTATDMVLSPIARGSDSGILLITAIEQCSPDDITWDGSCLATAGSQASPLPMSAVSAMSIISATTTASANASCLLTDTYQNETNNEVATAAILQTIAPTSIDNRPTSSPKSVPAAISSPLSAPVNSLPNFNLDDPTQLVSLGEAALFNRSPCSHLLKSEREQIALQYFEAAVRLGSIEAQALQGFCFEFGVGCEADFSLSEVAYKAAAKAGVGLAQARLAFLRRYGRPGVRIDRPEAEYWQNLINSKGYAAISWIVSAAEDENHAAAQYCLGVCYHDGVGVERDACKAFQWYKKSAEQGHPRGQGILGYCYGEAFGCERDEVEAMKWYLKAAEQGESVAIYNVGYCLEEGLGCEKVRRSPRRKKRHYKQC